MSARCGPGGSAALTLPAGLGRAPSPTPLAQQPRAGDGKPTEGGGAAAAGRGALAPPDPPGAGPGPGPEPSRGLFSMAPVSHPWTHCPVYPSRSFKNCNLSGFLVAVSRPPGMPGTHRCPALAEWSPLGSLNFFFNLGPRCRELRSSPRLVRYCHLLGQSIRGCPLPTLSCPPGPRVYTKRFKVFRCVSQTPTPSFCVYRWLSVTRAQGLPLLPL